MEKSNSLLDSTLDIKFVTIDISENNQQVIRLDKIERLSKFRFKTKTMTEDDFCYEIKFTGNDLKFEINEEVYNKLSNLCLQKNVINIENKRT